MSERKTHCKVGHEFTPENTYMAFSKTRGIAHRQCRTCKNSRNKECYEATTENLYATKKDWTSCNRCSTPIPLREVKQDLGWLVEHKKSCKGVVNAQTVA